MSRILVREDHSGPAERVGALPTFWGAYCTYKEECVNYGEVWGEGTQGQYESIILNHLVPNLPNHDKTALCWYTWDELMGTIARIAERGKNDDSSNFKPFDEGTLGKHLHIMKTVVAVASENEGFLNVFEGKTRDYVAKKTDRIQRMKELWLLPKSFSVDEEWRVAKYLLQHLDTCGEAIALWLMYSLGLRNEEACAVNFGHILELTEYPGNYYIAVPQSTHLHRNETRLEVKTYNAYRYVPIPSVAMKVLLALKDRGILAIHNKDDSMGIEKMPVAHHGKDLFKRCSADAVTRQAKKMFEELGMRETLSKVGECLRQDIQFAEEEKDNVDEFALVEKEPSAYLLRRNFATHMAILQLTEAQLSSVLGHVIEDPQVQRSDFTNDYELFAIKTKMDKRPILNDISLMPSWVIESNSVVAFSGYSQEFALNSAFGKATIQATAKEPGDSIAITVEQRNGATIKETIDIGGIPFPGHFARETNVLKAYHEAFRKEEASDQGIDLRTGEGK